MVQINKSSNFVVSWVLLFVVIVFLSACSTFVSQTQNDIAGRPAANDLNFYVNKSQKVLACVQQPGGDCPADVAAEKTADTKLAEKASIIASVPAYKSDAIKALMKKAPITIENIKTGMSKGAIAPASTSVDSAQVKAANFAAAALTDPTVVKLEELYQEAIGIKDPQPDKPLTISKNEVGQYAKSIQEATNFNGWASFRFYLQSQLTEKNSLRNKSLDDQSQIIALESAVKQLTIIEAYLPAYFENGEFVSLDIDVSNAEASAIKALKEKFKVSDAVAKELSVKLLTAIIGTAPGADNKYHLLTKMKDGGFVTRGGTKYVFPGLSVNIDPLSDSVLQVAKIDFTQVGSDVVRVFLEALGDELGQLPADQTSTACKAKTAGQFDDYKNFRCYVENDQTVKAAQFTKVNEHASQAESLAATATGQALRGVSWLSLNNEALAKIIETAVGVVARKATEKVAWCVYACIPKANPEAAFYGDGEIQTVPLSVEK